MAAQTVAGLDVDMAEPDFDETPSVFQVNGKTLKARAAKRLWQPQQDALSSLERWYRDRPGQVGLVVMPTGTGKTGVICCLPYYLAVADIPSVDFRKPILVVAPNLDIQKQLMEQLTPTGAVARGRPFLLKRGIVPDTHKGHNVLPSVKTVENSSDLREDVLVSGTDIVVSNAQKWHKRDNAIWEEMPGDTFSLVIVDEAHHLPAPQWKDIVDKFKGYAKVAFFTATPYRADKKKITDDIAETGFAYELKREEALAMHPRIIRELNYIEITPELKCDISCQGYPEDKAHPHHIVDVINEVFRKLDEKDRDLPLPGGKKHVAMIAVKYKHTVVGAGYVEQFIHAHYPEELYGKAVAIHFELPKGRKEQAMVELEKGKIRILIIVNMLLEGFDHPPVSIAAICTNISSEVKFAQFIGRAQRIVRHEGEEEDPQVKADIITHPIFKQRQNYTKFEDGSLMVIPEKYKTKKNKAKK